MKCSKCKTELFEKDIVNTTYISENRRDSCGCLVEAWRCVESTTYRCPKCFKTKLVK